MAALVNVALALLVALAASTATAQNTTVFNPIKLPDVIKNRQPLDPKAVYGSLLYAKLCYPIAYRVIYDSIVPDEIGAHLRLAFHDAGPYDATDEEDRDSGANGSILYERCEDADFTNPAKFFFPNCGRLSPAIDKTIEVVKKIRKQYPVCAKLTYADAIQLFGAASVAKAGGPTCPLYLGRQDKNTPDKHISNLPGPCSNVYLDDLSGPFGPAPSLVNAFTRMGFYSPVKAVVYLSGGHNVGKGNVVFPTCAQTKDGANNDLTASQKFDGHYYKEIYKQVGKKGFFDSDKKLAIEPVPEGAYLPSSIDITRKLSEDFSKGKTKLFFTNWCEQYQEMSLLGWDTTKMLGAYKPQGGWPVVPFPAYAKGIDFVPELDIKGDDAPEAKEYRAGDLAGQGRRMLAVE